MFLFIFLILCFYIRTALRSRLCSKRLFFPSFLTFVYDVAYLSLFGQNNLSSVFTVTLETRKIQTYLTQLQTFSFSANQLGLQSVRSHEKYEKINPFKNTRCYYGVIIALKWIHQKLYSTIRAICVIRSSICIVN